MGVKHRKDVAMRLKVTIRSFIRQIYIIVCSLPGAILWFSGKRDNFISEIFSSRNDFLMKSFRMFVLNLLFYTDVPKYRELIVGLSGNKWCDMYHSRISNYEEVFAGEFDLIQNLLDEKEIKTVLQVGCAGGGELSYLAKRNPKAIFVGIDLNEYTIRRNSVTFKEQKNLTFVYGNIFNSSIIKYLKPQLIFTSGCAEYFTEDELKKFIETARDEKIRFIFFHEPISLNSFDYRQDIKSRPRGNMAFNHNYSYYLRYYGYEVKKEILSQPNSSNVIDVDIIGELPAENLNKPEPC